MPFELRVLIESEIAKNGPSCDLNHLDLSPFTHLDGAFSDLDFTGDISQWDVSHVVSMNRMFIECPFNGDISRWDTSRVQTMSRMFGMSQFNGDISGWNIQRVKNTARMFEQAAFAGDLSSWFFDPLCTCEGMFSEGFKGVLPTPRTGQYAHAEYNSMMGEYFYFNAYLHAMPMNAVHIELVLREHQERCPPWLAEADFDWLMEQKHLLHLAGCSLDEARAVVKEQLRLRGTTPVGLPADVLRGILV